MLLEYLVECQALYKHFMHLSDLSGVDDTLLSLCLSKKLFLKVRFFICKGRSYIRIKNCNLTRLSSQAGYVSEVITDQTGQEAVMDRGSQVPIPPEDGGVI